MVLYIFLLVFTVFMCLYISYILLYNIKYILYYISMYKFKIFLWNQKQLFFLLYFYILYKIYIKSVFYIKFLVRLIIFDWKNRKRKNVLIVIICIVYKYMRYMNEWNNCISYFNPNGTFNFYLCISSFLFLFPVSHFNLQTNKIQGKKLFSRINWLLPRKKKIFTIFHDFFMILNVILMNFWNFLWKVTMKWTWSSTGWKFSRILKRKTTIRTDVASIRRYMMCLKS